MTCWRVASDGSTWVGPHGADAGRVSTRAPVVTLVREHRVCVLPVHYVDCNRALGAIHPRFQFTCLLSYFALCGLVSS